MISRVADDVFESGCDLIEVTSNHRPDTSWRFVDASGHAHQWFRDGQPATSYSPSASYSVPSTTWVKDGKEYWDDCEEPHDVGHYECSQCGADVVHGYTADDTTQYIPGFRWFRINGESVSAEVFALAVGDADTRRQS